MNFFKKTKITRAATLITIAILLSGCAAEPEYQSDELANTQSQDVLTDFGLSGLESKEIIGRLENIRLSERPKGLQTSIRSEKVILADSSGRSAEIILPSDEFYVSFSPYISQTHDCFFHSPTGCVGELGNEVFDIRVINTLTNEVITEETIESADNGFIGLWLPRDIEATVMVSYNSLSATAQIRTGSEDPTCITTLKLQ